MLLLGFVFIYTNIYIYINNHSTNSPVSSLMLTLAVAKVKSRALYLRPDHSNLRELNDIRAHGVKHVLELVNDRNQSLHRFWQSLPVEMNEPASESALLNTAQSHPDVPAQCTQPPLASRSLTASRARAHARRLSRAELWDLEFSKRGARVRVKLLENYTSAFLFR